MAYSFLDTHGPRNIYFVFQKSNNLIALIDIASNVNGESSSKSKKTIKNCNACYVKQ